MMPVENLPNAAPTVGEEPLPYRRTIPLEESRAIFAGLIEKWGVGGGYWYPLAGDAPPHTIAVDEDAFYDEFGDVRLQRLLTDIGVTRVFELSEDPNLEEEYEIDLALLEVGYTKLEAYWTPPDQSWLIYASHESSLTFAGESLVEALQAQWPGWEQHDYLAGVARRRGQADSCHE